MRRQGAVGLLVGAFLATAGAIGVAQAPLTIDSGRVTLAGTSNVHAYTASTTKVLATGTVDAFVITIPAATLASPKGDIDKNMHKALKVDECPDITFRLIRFDSKPDAASNRAIGVLKIAGVEREVALVITTKRTGATLTVQGSLDLLMTDYGITPPKALMGMLKTDPKVTVTFETVLAIPLT